MHTLNAKRVGLLSLILCTTLLASACKKAGSTPESTWHYFSLAASTGQGLSKFAEADYAKNLEMGYDSLALLSAMWPREPKILDQSSENGIVTLKVEGTNPAGKPVLGIFKLRQDGDIWKVFEGDWGHFPQESSEAVPEDPAV